MSDTDISPGMLVVHPKRPEWGPGKVAKVDTQNIYVLWRDTGDTTPKTLQRKTAHLQLAPSQSDPFLDNLPPLTNKDGTLVSLPHRITFIQAVDEFLKRFPGGFYDPAYIDSPELGERHYKWDAHVECVKRLGNGRLRKLLSSDMSQLMTDILWCYRTLNIVSPHEKIPLTDALKDAGASVRMLSSLADVLDADTISEETFGPYLEAISDLPAKRGKVATWPIATIVPFLMFPDRHLFLKPDITKKAADMLAFNLNYRPELNWLTYERLLAMGKVYMDQLSSLKPRDMIDLQSFFWVVCSEAK